MRLIEQLESRRLLTAPEIEAMQDTSDSFSTPNGNDYIDRGYGISIHFRATSETLSTYDAKENRYEWDFGNGLVATGFNVAGVFVNASQVIDSQTTFTVTLTIKTAVGSSVSDTITVDVIKASYTGGTIYVDGTGGNDTLSGSSTGSPVKTLNRALKLLANDNTRILLKRGTTIDCYYTGGAYDTYGKDEIQEEGVYIGLHSSWGSGADPIVQIKGVTSGTSGKTVFWSSDEAHNLRINHVKIITESGSLSADNGNVLEPRARNTTISNVVFDNVNHFVKVETTTYWDGEEIDHITEAIGVLVVDCDSFEHVSDTYSVQNYELFVNENQDDNSYRASMVCMFGNTFGRSKANHNTRTLGDFINIYGNDLTQYKNDENASNLNSLRANAGNYISWGKNVLHGGQAVVGDWDSDSLQSIMFIEDNTLLIYPYPPDYSKLHPRMHFTDGADNIVVRNNIIEAPSMTGIAIESGSHDIWLYYNTVVNQPTEEEETDYDGETGRFLYVRDNDDEWAYADISDIELKGNLYEADDLVPSTSTQTAAIYHQYDSDDGVSSFGFLAAGTDVVNFNLWDVSGSTSNLFLTNSRTNGNPGSPNYTQYSLSSWNSFSSQIGTDAASDVNLDGDYRCTSSAGRIGAAVAGVVVDEEGNPRPSGGLWMVGALE